MDGMQLSPLVLPTPIAAGDFDSIPAELQAELNSDYAAALYGPAARFKLDQTRVIWPSLLSSSGRATLKRAVYCRGVQLCNSKSRSRGQHCAERNSTVLFVQPPGNFLNSEALWVHQPEWRLPRPPVTDQWAEVSHCFYWSPHEHVHPGTPMFFFHAPGSGVWLNVGRTLLVESSDPSLIAHMHKAVILGYDHRIEPLLDELRNRSTVGNISALHDYDSVQFPLYGYSSSWGGQRFTEIVMLKWGREMSFVSQHINHVRCGQLPDLRPCNETEAAIQVQIGRAHV